MKRREGDSVGVPAKDGPGRGVASLASSLRAEFDDLDAREEVALLVVVRIGRRDRDPEERRISGRRLSVEMKHKAS